MSRIQISVGLTTAGLARCSLMLAALLLAGNGLAHDEYDSKEIRFSTAGAEIAGTLVLPPHAKRIPCIVLVGGTLSQTRDGAMTNRNLPARDAKFAREVNPAFDSSLPARRP